MKKTIFVLILALSLVSQAVAQTATKLNSPARKAADNITAAQIKDYLYFIASDEMEGRDTPSRGLDITAKFIGMNLSRWGIKPAGDDGTFYQKIALRGSFVDSANAIAEVAGQKFIYGDDYVQVTGAPNANLNVNLVYGGNGWLIKSKNIDALAGVDVKGKFVVVYVGSTPSSLPSGITDQDISNDKYGTDWLEPVSHARSKGAAGIIVVASDETQNRWAQTRDYYSRGRFVVEKLSKDNVSRQNQNSSTFTSILANRRMANALFIDETLNPFAVANSSAAAFDLKSSKKIVLNIPVRTEIVMTQNVIGIIEGSDPQLKNEIVAIGAHYDHIGIRNPGSQSADKINNGADDDGSGTTGVLAIAEALAKSGKRPKRSILFVWHAGEEKGLWGSEYFTRFPTVPLNKVVAQLNIDMIGRSKKAGDANPKNKELSGEREIYVIGSKMMSSKLGEIVDGTNNSYLKLNYNFRYDDPKDPNRFFFRSDHFNYAVKNIPIAFWFDGVHEDYHGAGDSPDKIDYNKMEAVTKTIFLTMWELADLIDRPVVDKQLPPELTQR